MGLRRSSFELGQLVERMREKEASYRRFGYIASADAFKARAEVLERQRLEAAAHEAEALALAGRAVA